jgi:20S proteasome subunit beta 2
MAEQLSANLGVFNFENCARNNFIQNQGSTLPKFRKTGTTIVGVCYKDGVVLGADTRATGDTTVCDKNCQKIHYLAPNIYCCGAGTAADTEKTTDMIAGQLHLHRMASGRDSRVCTAKTMLADMLFRYQGHVSAALVLGGVDINGPHIYTVYPHGSTDNLPYATMGSGSLAAMSVFEARYQDDMELEDAKFLVRDAIRAGIFNDLGSGGNVDLTVIAKGQPAEILRNYQTPNERAFRRTYDFVPGTTPTLSTRVEVFEGSAPDISDIGEGMAVDI